MIKLLRSNLSRTIKSKTLWICMALYALYAILLPIIMKNVNSEAFDISGAKPLLATGYGIAGFPLQGMLIATLSCLILGTDFHNGAFRNKLIVGRSRTQIYAANLLTSFVISLALSTIYLIFFLTISLPLLGSFATTARTVLLLLLDGTLMLLSYSAIYTFIVMTSKNTTVSIIISFVLLFASMMLIMYLEEILNEEPYYIQFVRNEFGETVEQLVPNPNMPSKSLKNFCQFILDFFPSGQSYLLSNNNEFRWQMALYSIILIGGTSGAGMLIFNKTNIK